MPRIRHVENGSSREYPLGEVPITVGRAGRHAIPTMDSRASRDHFTIEFSGGRYVARDLGSRNGTLLNGEPLSAPRELKPGDRLQIGEATFEFLDGTLTTPAPDPPRPVAPPPAPPLPAPAIEASPVAVSPSAVAPIIALRIREPGSAERTVTLSELPMVVGRVPECHIVVNHEKISSRHCEISLCADGVRVRDLKSTNGIRFKGTPFEERTLLDGEEFTAGPIVFVVIDPRTASAGLPPVAKKALPLVALAAAVLLLLGAAAAFAPALLRLIQGAPPETAADPGNLIRINAGFEDPAFGGWTVTAVEGKAEVGVDAAVKHEGLAALKIRGIDTRDRSRIAATSERVALEAGKRLRLAGWMKTSGLEGNAGFRIEWLAGTQVIGVAPTDMPTGSIDWRRLSVVGAPPPGADGARASCLVAGLAGLAWFDSVRLEVTEDADGGESWQTLGGTLHIDGAGFIHLGGAEGPLLWNGEMQFVRDADVENPTPHWIGERDGDPSSVGLGYRIVRRMARLGSVTFIALHAEDQDGLTWNFDIATEGEARFAASLSPSAAASLTTRSQDAVEPRQGDFTASRVDEIVLGSGPSISLSDPATVELKDTRLTISWPKTASLSMFLRNVPTWTDREIRTLAAQATAAEKAGQRGKALLCWAELAGRHPGRAEGKDASRRSADLRKAADDMLAGAKQEVANAKKFPSKAGLKIALEKIEALGRDFEGTEYAEFAAEMKRELVPDEKPADPPPGPETPAVEPPKVEPAENARKLLGWAEEALGKEEWLKAEIYAKNVMDRWPGSPEGMKAGEVLGRARSGAKAAAERDGWIRDQLAKARNLVRNGQPDKARPLFEEVLQKHPGHPLVKGVRDELDKLGK